MSETPENNLLQIRADCQQLLLRQARLAAGASLVPLPGVDMLSDIALFTDLIQSVNQRFGLSHTDLAVLPSSRRDEILLLATRMGSEWIGRWISRELIAYTLKKVAGRWLSKSLIRVIPLAGQLLSAGLSYQLMKRLGERHIDDCYHLASKLVQSGRAKVI